jgi:hypothetical protein
VHESLTKPSVSQFQVWLLAHLFSTDQFVVARCGRHGSAEADRANHIKVKPAEDNSNWLEQTSNCVRDRFFKVFGRMHKHCRTADLRNPSTLYDDGHTKAHESERRRRQMTGNAPLCDVLMCFSLGRQLCSTLTVTTIVARINTNHAQEACFACFKVAIGCREQGEQSSTSV